MLATIRDDTSNVLNMQHITPNSKRWDYSDIPGGGHNPHGWRWPTTLEKPQPSHALTSPLRHSVPKKLPAFLCEWSLWRISYCKALCPDIDGSKQMNRIGLDIPLWKSKTYYM